MLSHPSNKIHGLNESSFNLAEISSMIFCQCSIIGSEVLAHFFKILENDDQFMSVEIDTIDKVDNKYSAIGSMIS